MTVRFDCELMTISLMDEHSGRTALCLPVFVLTGHQNSSYIDFWSEQEYY